jgi:type IV pilus assembly protein PilX
MKNRTSRKDQSGVVLFVALMLLVILSMIGVTVARMQTVEERMARNENNRQLATQAAEAALRYAEYQLLNAPTSSVFAQDTGGYWVISTTTGSSVTTPTGIPPALFSTPANVMPYNGPPLTQVPAGAARAPNIIIELVGYGTIPGDTLPTGQSPPPVYRITVQGYDADGTPSVILQEVYR